MDDSLSIRDLYKQLWTGAVAQYQQGTVRVNPYLQDIPADHRSGLTLIARCANPALVRFLDDLRGLVPEQYIYQPPQLHVTVLTLVPVRVPRLLESLPIARYHALFTEIVHSSPAIDIHFQGITATDEAVMIQGFPGPSLNRLREQLRESLRTAGLGDDLDIRYKVIAAHITLLRFASVPPKLPVFYEWLAEQRQKNQDFGVVRVPVLEFVYHDYFLLPDKTRVLASYPLE